MTIIIRKMTRKDMKQVQDIAKTTWHATYDGIIPRDIQNNFLDKAYSLQMMKQRLKQPYFFVAEVKGKVVGFSQFTVPDQQGMTELVAIYLYPDYQGIGIGSAFLKEGMKHLKDVKEIQLNVEKDNHIGRQFYEAKGFSVISEYQEDFAGHVLNTMRMALKMGR
ncbi:GNAT family N-acetyltransferase [Virgibacillus sp. MSJ-26]|uniref:GNAT family N-acetyltransferase n=1 Tax=Virgibacillus sp. MSJ-26 TaxID=2841522 RepID=UPI001C0FAE7F|nr:GNAT family N-acetyltransferase [Virgibacillus sp. MSJ-26]MBU5465972.1 GNAT family N-acetyltransferase [Virgibacillus sp. MSJ-26]